MINTQRVPSTPKSSEEVVQVVPGHALVASVEPLVRLLASARRPDWELASSDVGLVGPAGSYGSRNSTVEARHLPRHTPFTVGVT